MKKEEMVNYIAKCIEENPEYQRLLSLRWEQRLLTAKVNSQGMPSSTGSCVRYLKIMADPYIGISVNNALDPANCFVAIHMPLSVNPAARAHYSDSDFGLKDLQEPVEAFFNRLSTLENISTFSQLSQYERTSGHKVFCAFTG